MSDVGETLAATYPFADSIIERVEKVAAEQQKHDKYKDYFAAIDLPVPERIPTFHMHGNPAAPLEVLDVKPKVKYDEKKARLFLLPMANYLDPNMLFQAATIQQSDPETRLIAISNPGTLGHNSGSLRRHRPRSIVANGDLMPMTSHYAALLQKLDIVEVEFVGYSLGAELSASAARRLQEQQFASRAVLIEPVTFKERTLRELGDAFKASEAPLQGYVEANKTTAFLDAREHSPSKFAYMLGLARLTNFAIEQALLHTMFEKDLDHALTYFSGMSATVIRGVKSELCDDELAGTAMRSLQLDHGWDRVHDIAVEDEYHAWPNHLHKFAAFVLEGLHRRPVV